MSTKFRNVTVVTFFFFFSFFCVFLSPRYISCLCVASMECGVNPKDTNALLDLLKKKGTDLEEKHNTRFRARVYTHMCIYIYTRPLHTHITEVRTLQWKREVFIAEGSLSRSLAQFYYRNNVKAASFDAARSEIALTSKTAYFCVAAAFSSSRALALSRITSWDCVYGNISRRMCLICVFHATTRGTLLEWWRECLWCWGKFSHLSNKNYEKIL